MLSLFHRLTLVTLKMKMKMKVISMEVLFFN